MYTRGARYRSWYASGSQICMRSSEKMRFLDDLARVRATVRLGPNNTKRLHTYVGNSLFHKGMIAIHLLPTVSAEGGVLWCGSHNCSVCGFTHNRFALEAAVTRFPGTYPGIYPSVVKTSRSDTPVP